MYQTRVSSYADGHIAVTFREEFENTGFPLMLREEVIRQAQSYGGSNWLVYGIVEQGFSNVIGGWSWKSHAVKLTGYNYDMLYRFAGQLLDTLAADRRVSEPGIFSDDRYRQPENEFFISYDRERIARAGLDMGSYYNILEQQLFESPIGTVFDGREVSRVVMASAGRDTFDRWHIENDMVNVDSTSTRLADVGAITMMRSGNDIVRVDQQYQLIVGFNHIGARELADRRLERTVEMMNEQVLPIGYKAEAVSNQYTMTAKDNWRMALLLMLVVAVIYSLCAVIFESLRKPFVVLLLIPVGFIGLFLTFSLGGFVFDQGGVAAMVMMCGIVVNAGIYIVSEYNTIRRARSGAVGAGVSGAGAAAMRSAVEVYVRAYNRKIIPTLLTIVSTVLGLVPFLFDGSDNVFWFAFAVGVMGSMLFSLLALVVWLPVFFPLGDGRRRGGKI
jgi:multidrug efflux pump subunit AcrB